MVCELDSEFINIQEFIMLNHWCSEVKGFDFKCLMIKSNCLNLIFKY